MHQAPHGLTESSNHETISQCCSRRVRELEAAASQACVMRQRQMRARGPCSARSNAATRLPIHRRLQAGINVALQRLPSHAKIETQGIDVTSRRRPRCARLGRAATAGDCYRARGPQRRRAPMVWSDLSLAPLTFLSRLSGCYCSRRRRFRTAECDHWQRDRQRATLGCIARP